MAWTWIRPESAAELEARPFVDLGAGDGQTLQALTAPSGLRVAIDRRSEPLRSLSGDRTVQAVVADAKRVPLRTGTVATVLAADLVHHLDDGDLRLLLREAHRVLRPGGHLLAWWYLAPGRPAPDAPAHPRSYESVARAARAAGFMEVERLPLKSTVEPAPPTAGMMARR